MNIATIYRSRNSSQENNTKMSGTGKMRIAECGKSRTCKMRNIHAEWIRILPVAHFPQSAFHILILVLGCYAITTGYIPLFRHPLFRHPLFRHPLFRHLCLLCILAKYTHYNISIINRALISNRFPTCPSSRSCWNDWLASKQLLRYLKDNDLLPDL